MPLVFCVSGTLSSGYMGFMGYTFVVTTGNQLVFFPSQDLIDVNTGTFPYSRRVFLARYSMLITLYCLNSFLSQMGMGFREGIQDLLSLGNCQNPCNISGLHLYDKGALACGGGEGG